MYKKSIDNFPHIGAEIYFGKEIERFLRIKLALLEIMDSSEEAAKNFRFKLEKENCLKSRDFMKRVFGPYDFFPNPRGIWLTNNAESIYSSSTNFHITGSEVLNSLTEDKDIIAPKFHIESGTITHRGMGLGYLTYFLNQIGMSLGQKDIGIWSGTKLDGEQFVIEDYIASNGVNIDKRLDTLLFEEGGLRLNSKLTELFNMLANNIRPIDSKEMTNFVTRFLYEFFLLTGMREGWYEIARKKLLGIDPSLLGKESFLDLKISDFMMSHKMLTEGRMNRDPGYAVVLELDTKKALEGTAVGGINALTVVKRNPKNILYLPKIVSEAIGCIYVDNIDRVPIEVKRRFEVKHISLLGRSVWINNITPESISMDKIDPSNPFCQLRYEEEPFNWKKLILSGGLVPLVSDKDWIYGIFNYLDSFGNQLFDSIGDFSDSDWDMFLSFMIKNKPFSGVFSQ